MKLQKSGSKKPRPKIKLIVIAALFSGAAILFSGCENDLEKIKAFTSPEDLPILYAENYQSTHIDSGQVRNYLEAPILQQFETDGNPFLEFPKGVLLNKFDGKNKVISSITADYAKQFTKEKKWEAKNNVIAVNSDGDTLKTEHLTWEEKTGKIYSDRYVTFIREDKIIHGNGFESDQDMGKWRILEVKGTIYIDMESSKSPEAAPTKNTPAAKGDTNIANQKKLVPLKRPVNIKK